MKIIRNNTTSITYKVIPTSWDEMVKNESGTLYMDWFQNGVRCLIVGGPASLCAYLGVPEGHPLSGVYYDDLGELDVHGGLTYSGIGDGINRPKGYYWFGWDYGHCDDECFYSGAFPLGLHIRGRRKWFVGEVYMEVRKVVPAFKRIMEEAEDENLKES